MVTGIGASAPLRVEEESERIKKEYNEEVAERFRREIAPHVQKGGTITYTDALDAKDRALLKLSVFNAASHGRPE